MSVLVMKSVPNTSVFEEMAYICMSISSFVFHEDKSAEQMEQHRISFCLSFILSTRPRSEQTNLTVKFHIRIILGRIILFALQDKEACIVALASKIVSYKF